MAKILLAEDEAVLRMLVTDTLEDENYQIDEACDGEEALALIRNKDYDLIILDYMMPKKTGYDVLLEVRQMEHKKHVKILMLSAKSQQSDQDKIRKAGADDFMTKPFSPLALVEKVGEMIHE
ncbi:MAG: cheY [Paenibacillus sp.]|jgi:DNA-binding response OmpR family regulator|nr:cheY [Paenibacillus sp.]